MLKLKDSVILKKVNSNCVYSINCEDPEDFFFKFEGVSKIFIENVAVGIEENELVKLVVSQFPNTAQDDIERDLRDFTSTIEEHKLINK